MFEMLTSFLQLQSEQFSLFSNLLQSLIISNVDFIQNAPIYVVQSKPEFLKILIFVELVFCNNFKCELKKFHKMDPSKLGFLRY